VSTSRDPMKLRRAILERRQPIDIRDVSRGGCCVHAAQPLPVGSVGVLAVTIDGETHAEVFRVARSAIAPGPGSRYQAGVEFLPMPAEMRSLAEIVSQLDHCDGQADLDPDLDDSDDQNP
jgi:hypothetical protein